MVRRGRLVLLLAGTFAALSCRTPTQIEIEIMSDLSCDEIVDVSITAGLPSEVEGAQPTTVTRDCVPVDGGSRIGTLVIAPSGDKESAVGIRVVGAPVPRSAELCTADNAYEGCIVSRRSLNYVPHAELALRIDLRRACIDVACSPETTCVQGECKSSLVRDPSRCTGDGCDEGDLEGGGGLGGGGQGGVGGEGGSGQGGGSPATLTLLPTDSIPGVTISKALGVSPDGSVVVGEVNAGGPRIPVVWREGSMIQLNRLVNDSGAAFDASSNGDVVVGTLVVTQTNQSSAVRWSWDPVLETYGPPHTLTSSTSGDAALAVSADGLTIVGRGALGTVHVWRSNTVYYGNQEVGYFYAVDDGGTVAGGTVQGGGRLLDLGASGASLVQVSDTLRVAGISADAALAVGTEPSLQGFMIDLAGGSPAGPVQLLGGVGEPRAVARASSGALRIVGRCQTSGEHACIWIGPSGPWAAIGKHPTVPAWSLTAGIDFTGIELRDAAGISAAGDVIVGWGQGGQPAAWRLDVPPLSP